MKSSWIKEKYRKSLRLQSCMLSITASTDLDEKSTGAQLGGFLSEAELLEILGH